MRAWPFAAILLVGTAQAQTISQAQGRLASANVNLSGGVISGMQYLGSAPQITHPAALTTIFGDPDLCVDNVNGSVNLGLSVCRIVQSLAVGSGNITGSGHHIGLYGEATWAVTGTTDLQIGLEGTSQITNGGTATISADILAHMNANNGTMSEHDGVRVLFDSNTGMVGVHNGYKCDIATLGNVGQANCINNADPAQAIRNSGPYVNSLGQELSSQRAGVIAGRYYYGITPSSGGTSTLTTARTFVYYALLTVPERTTYTKLGFQVGTGVAGATCQASIYPVAGGEPVGAPRALSGALSAAAAGPQEGTVSVTLDAGLYAAGVNCSSDSVAMSTYVETSLQGVLGSTTPTGGETTPVSGALTYGTWQVNPTFGYVATGNFAPLVWVRK